MATQEYSALTNEFTLDLHNVRLREATRAIKARIRECHDYGIRRLKCVYGSPERYEGSISQALIDNITTDDRVETDLLPDWIYEEAIDVSHMPTFIVVPLKVNPNAASVGPKSQFSGFTAECEKRRSLRLLCKMPFQPFRELYEWDYAARAIGGKCKASLLREYCGSSGLGVRDGGLTLNELMSCADGYPKWKRDKGAPARLEVQQAETVLTPPATSQFTPYEQPRDCKDLLFLAQRLLADGEFRRCRDVLQRATGLVTADAQSFQLELLLGKVLVAEGSAECEGHLLRADGLCKRLEGETSIKRIEIGRLLARWYMSTGEVSEILKIQERLQQAPPDCADFLTPKRRFVNDYGYAVILREAGFYQESVYIIRLFAWEVLLKHTGPMPSQFPVSLEELTKSEITRRQAAKMHLLYAMNATDERDEPLASEMLDKAYLLLKDAERDEIRIEIEQERGRIARKRGDNDGALRHYAVAEGLMKEFGIVDRYLMYKLNLSRGVAYASKGERKPAGQAYERAWIIAGELGLQSHPFVYGLLQSRAALALRREDFSTCARFAGEAADLLTLNAEGRHRDIALARLRQGVALAHLGEVNEARRILLEAKSAFQAAGGAGDHESQLEGYLRTTQA